MTIWRDVLLQSPLSDGKIVSALAAAFSVGKEQVHVSDSLEEISEQTVFCLKEEISGGSFRELLTLYTAAEVSQPDDVLTRISRLLEQQVLTSNDESNSPYAMVLFDPSGRKTNVDVVAKDLDEKNIYNLVNEPTVFVELKANTDSSTDAPPNWFRMRVESGNKCPQSGYWITPAKTGSRRRFEQGEVMPSVGGDYGATIWQWDENQVA